MCGRYCIPEVDSAEALQAIIDEANRRNKGALIRTGEIRPTDTAPVLANNRALVPSAFAMKWGYTLPDGRVVFNARSESASSRPMFHDGMTQRRCLVPAAYYFEWERRGREKIRYASGQNERGILYMAGIYRLERGVPVFTILVAAVANYTGEQAIYQNAPTFAYHIGQYAVDKNGLLTGPIDNALIQWLADEGFTSEE